MDIGPSEVENLGMSSFWQGRRVLVTGHTGFKGSWLGLWLQQMGAQVSGLSLAPDTPFFASLGYEDAIDHHIGDIRDLETVVRTIAGCDPQVVIHMAAQSLVLRGYAHPLDTWAVNVTGSLHVLEAVRRLGGKRAVVMVTTDKVYANAENTRPFREDDPLGGHDPYSASKAAMEIAIDSWRKSYGADGDIRLASARAGNVIGGGDWAQNRLVPDAARALATGDLIEVRNPQAVRPWQHVLDPLRGYLTLAQKLWEQSDTTYQTAFNFGPDASGIRDVRDVVTAALQAWPGQWKDISGGPAPHEAQVLRLDVTRARDILGHSSRWDFARSIHETMTWYRSVHDGADPRRLCLDQLATFGVP